MKVESLGRIAVATGGIFSIGALCYYGLGLSSKPGAIERASLWPRYVRERVRDTYVYLGGTLGVTAVAACVAARSDRLLRIVAQRSLVGLGVSIVALIGSGMIVRSIPYEERFWAKHGAWTLHAALLGLLLSPLVLLGGPLLIRASAYTGGVVGGLSVVAMCAPSDSFLRVGGALGAALGVVVVASLGSAFLPVASALGSTLHSVSLYGGLLVFGGLLLFDTQRVVHRAETLARYDPINGCLSIYMDIMNIFIRIVSILSGGSRRK